MKSSATTLGRKFLSYRDLRDRGIPYSRVHLRRLEKLGCFPRHITLGAGAELHALKAWLLEEIEAWEAARIAARDTKVA
jgi:prophage regulatory protein